MIYSRFASTVPASDEKFTKSQTDALAALLSTNYFDVQALNTAYALLEKFGHQSVYDGAYGIFTADDTLRFTSLCLQFFPKFRGAVIVFGRDWLGYLYAADFSRVQAEQPTVVLFDINTGDSLTTNLGIESFHEIAVLDEPEKCFQIELYTAWLHDHPAVLSPTRCVGYTIPLALGGEDDFANMSETDLEVYWELTGQIGLA